MAIKLRTPTSVNHHNITFFSDISFIFAISICFKTLTRPCLYEIINSIIDCFNHRNPKHVKAFGKFLLVKHSSCRCSAIYIFLCSVQFARSAQT